MRKKIAIAYVSSAVALLSDTELDALLLDARSFNAKLGVTGVLLYHDGTFFQYIEGDESDVKNVFAKIAQSKIHHGIIELINEPVEQLNFKNWHMGFSAASKDQLIALERANWNTIANGLQGKDVSSPGIELLLQFWNGVRKG